MEKFRSEQTAVQLCPRDEMYRMIITQKTFFHSYIYLHVGHKVPQKGNNENLKTFIRWPPRGRHSLTSTPGR